jgi:poly(A) polymerase
VLRQALEDALLAPAVLDALQWLHESGILAVALPEMEATVRFTQEVGRRHKDVWEHTKQVVAQASRVPAVRWAALLHDIGKVPTRAIADDGKVTFYGHAEVGARMFDRISRRLAFPRPLHARVRWLILHHSRVNQYDGSWTDSAVRRFYTQMGEHLEQLFLLSRADVTSARQDKRDRAAQLLGQLAARVAALRELDEREPPLPSGFGTELMRRFSLPPGRRIGELKRALEVAIERGELEAHQPSEVYFAHLERCGWVQPVEE